VSDLQQIRHATAVDAPVLTALALRAKAHWGYDQAFMAACVDELSYPPDRIAALAVRVIAEGDAVQGFLALDLGSGEVEAVFVEPAVIGHGHGRRLMEAAIEIGRNERLTALRVDSDPFAEGFYRRMGFKPIGRSPSRSIPGRFLLRLCLDL